MTRTSILALGGLLAAAGLAGCATTPPPAAVTAFARTGCAETPDLSKAISLTPPKPKAVYTVATPVNAQTACLARPGGSRPYLVYALPADPAGKTLMIGGVLEGARILSPETVLLDRQGAVARTFQPGDYFYRGGVYSVEFTPRANEAYALVSVDPARVGKSYDAIAIGTASTGTYAAGVYVNWRSGVDTKTSRTFSYEGSVEATVLDGNKPGKP